MSTRALQQPPPRSLVRDHDHDAHDAHDAHAMSASTAIANSAISTLYRILVYLFLQVVSPSLLSPAPPSQLRPAP